MKQVNTLYNFWVGGYYDDFSSSRAVADDLNDANVRTLDHTKTHFGSAIGENARLNPKFKYSFPERKRTGIYLSGEPTYDYTTEYQQLGGSDDDKLTHNGSISQWLKYDETRDNTTRTFSQAKPKVPNSVLGNRQRLKGSAGDSYLAFFNGHDSNGKYYCPLGEMDFSWGVSPISNPDIEISANVLDKYAGSPISFLQTGRQTSGYPSHDSADGNLNTISFASVYVAESPNTDSTDNRPTFISHEIKSPSKNVFFINNMYVAKGSGNPTPTVTSGTERVITYDGPLRFKGIGESFHLRIAVHKVITDTDWDYTLKIGYKSTTTYNKSNDDFDDTTALMTVPITLADLGVDTAFTRFANGFPDEQPEVEAWCDIEVVPDFVANTWRAYSNGSTTSFANGTINVAVDKTTSYGWSLDANWSFNSTYYANIVTMIDRAAVAIPLTNKFDGTIPNPVTSFNMSTGANKISILKIDVLDDDNSYTLAPLTTGVATTEWKLFMFLNNEDRPIWQGTIESVDHRQDTKTQTLKTSITARDSLSILDRTLPIWELGQNAFISLSNHLSMASLVEKRIDETTAISDSLLMGSGNMGAKGTELGFSRYDTDTYSVGMSPIANGRCSLYSGSAIQIYINEDEDGPNNVEDEWEGDDVLHIMGHHPKQVDREFILKFDDRIYTGTPSPMLHIDTYGNIQDGDTIVVKGTTVDGTYTVNQMYLIKDNSTEEDTWFVRIRTTDTTGADTDDQMFEASNLKSLNSDYEGKTLIEITTSSAHNLSLGDEFCFPVGISIGASVFQHFTARPLKVIAVPTSTTLHVLVERWPYAVNNNQSVSGSDAMAYDLSVINGYDSKSYPKTPAVLYKQNTINLQLPQIRSKYRNLHARWMRDLPTSIWFKAQFGVIAAKPYWRHGKGSFLDRPFNSTQGSVLNSLYGWNSDGTVSVDTLQNDLTTSTTNFGVTDPAMWYHIKANRLREFIIDLVDKETGDHQYIIADTITEPNSNHTVTYSKTSEEFTTSSAHSLDDGQIVVHTGFYQEELNGVFMVAVQASSTKYKAWKVSDFPNTNNSFAYLKAKSRGESNWNQGISRHYEDPDGISATLLRVGSTDFDPDSSTSTVAKVRYGTSTISGVKGIKREWLREHTIYSLRKVDESNGYKHCFALWADMRNDGNADADGGYRKQDFGLIQPTPQNYEVSLSFADQFDENGDADVFTDLKIGEDLDIWSLDPTAEPFSASTWADLEGGSNEEPFDQYHNWQDKGGAVCLIDVSRFWNLNTNACGGRPGYESGGLVDFGDYETTTQGFPYLIDNYYLHATANYKNTNSSFFMNTHPNSNLFINDGTVLLQQIDIGEDYIVVQDASQFESSGYGVIQCIGGASRDSETKNYYFFWGSKSTRTDSAGRVGDSLEGVFITEYEIVTGPKNVIDQLKVDETAGSSGSDVKIGSNEFLTENVEGNFDKVRVFNSPAALFSFRLVLNLTGLVKAPNSGTYFASDKMRYMQSMILTDNWSSNSSLPCISDIANIPKTNELDSDNFGSVHDARGQTIMNLLNDMKEKEGNGLSGNLKTFSWLIGRDNRLDFRESYSSNHSFTRNNLKSSNLATQTGGKITNVRVYYNGNSAFADYPTPSGSDLRWRVLNYPDIFNREEALSIAKQEYLRENTSRISVDAEVIRDTGESNLMTSGGRFGYVSDVSRNLTYDNRFSLSWWSNNLGGQPFFGIQNALDTDAYTSDTDISTGIVYATTHNGSSAEDWATDNQLRLGIVSDDDTGLGSITAGASLASGGLIRIVTSSPPTYEWSYDNSGTYGPQVVMNSNNTWYTLTHTIGGTTYSLSVYKIDGTVAGTVNAFTYYNRAHRRTDSAYFWYGTNSLTNAVQVVHIDKNTPKVSESTGNEIRLAIAYDSGATFDVANFRLFALDYSFDEVVDTSGGVGNERPPLLTSTLQGSASVEIDGNGYFEITLPASYTSGTHKVLFSVDIDYLRDVLRFRGNNKMKNAHNVDGDTTYSTFDDDSCFPLGMRRFDIMGAHGDERAAFYAPRLHIVDDLNYIPATTLTYTDDYIDLDSETMVIRDIIWQQSGNSHEKVNLKLEKVESHYNYDFTRAFKRNNPQNTPRPGNPPSPVGPARPPFGGGLGSSVGGLQQLSTSSNVRDEQSQFAGLSSNSMAKSLSRGLKGRADFASDRASSNATWGVLGSKTTGKASSFDRAIDGLDSAMSSSGSAIATSEGFTLAGISDPEAGAQGETHSHSMNVRVPNDASTGYVSVLASVSLESVSGGGNAELTTTVTCSETGSSISNTKIISQGSNNSNVILLPTTFLDGASTANNTLTVTFERKPAQGNDNAGYQSLVIHNVSVNVRRYNNPTIAQSDTFRGY